MESLTEILNKLENQHTDQPTAVIEKPACLVPTIKPIEQPLTVEDVQVKAKAEKPKVEKPEDKWYSCDTANVKAGLHFPPPKSKKAATLTISGVIDKQVTATLHLNGQAAKSLYTMLKDAYGE